MRRAAAACAIALAAAGPACGGAPAPAPPPARARAKPPAPPAQLGPARYALTSQAGVLFDAAGAGAPLPRREPALYEGTRLLVDGGVIVAVSAPPEPLVGFTSVPSRLGGGFLVWSRDRTYRAADFMGPLTPIADAAAVGGARPFLKSMVLRTARGLLEVDPAGGVRPLGWPGVADVLALDARTAARLDRFGRASVTRDGGATWVDVQATEGALVSGLSDGDDRLSLLGASGSPALDLTPAGLVRAPRDPSLARRFSPENNLTFPPAEPEPLASSSRMLAPEPLSRAAAAGVLLPGGRILVARPEGLAVIAAATARLLADAPMRDVDPAQARCQAVPGAAAPAVLACTHRAGHVLRLDAAPSSPRLEATFPEQGRFFASPSGHLAHAGRCGQHPPSADDFLNGPPPPVDAERGREVPPWMRQQMDQAPPVEAVEPEAPPDPLPPDDARVCVRGGGGDDGGWREIRLRGEDARRLYRWIPGDGGRLTALVIAGKPGGPAPEPVPAGVRVIRVRADDPALGPASRRALFPAPLDPARSERFIDSDFWEEPDGSLRGWIHLPDIGAGSEGDGDRDAQDAEAREESESSKDDPDERPRLPLYDRRGGRFAGVRIDASGRITVDPLPAGVTQVVYGGPFALALAEPSGGGGSDDGDAAEAGSAGDAGASEERAPVYLESTDGGRTWRPVEGPPVGRLEPPSDLWSAYACSPVGCVLNDGGLVRLGWGSPPPRDPPPPPPAPPPPSTIAPRVPLLRCRLEGAPAPAAAPGPARHPSGARPAAPVEPPLITLRTRPSSPLGALRDRAWSAAVAPPFAPGAAPRRLSVRGATLPTVAGSVAPILLQPGSRGPVDLLLILGRAWVRAGDASPALLPFEHAGLITAAAELPGGALAVLDTDKGVVLVASRNGARPALWLTRVASPADARLTLGTRLDGKGLALVGTSVATGEVFGGALDLARAEVGPLESLGTLGGLSGIGEGACQGRALAQRFVASIPVGLRVEAEGGRVLLDEEVEASALLAAGGGQLCAEGVEARVEVGGGIEVRAVFGAREAASVRRREGEGRARCELEGGGR